MLTPAHRRVVSLPAPDRSGTHVDGRSRVTGELAVPLIAGSLALSVALVALTFATGQSPLLLPAAVLVSPVLVVAAVALVLRPQRGVLLLAALLPFDGLQQIVGFPAGWKEALTLAVLGATFVAPFAVRSAGRRLPQWGYLILALAAVGVVSAVLVGGSRGLVGLKVGFFYVLLGLAVWRCPLDARERDRLVSILMATGFATAMFGLVQQLLGPDRLVDLGYEYNTDIRTAGGFLRSFSTFDTSFAFALYLMVVVLVGLAVALGAPRRLRNRLFLLSLPVILAAMAVAITRVAFLGLAAGLVYMAITKYRSLVVVFIDGVVIAAVLLVAAASFSGAFLSTSSSEARFDLWGGNVAEIAAHPFGAGVGATGAAAEKAAEVVGSDEEVFQPDNYYFKLAYEFGVIGLWLFALFLVAAATSAHQVARRLTGTDAAFASGVTACVIAAAVACVVSTYFEIFPLDAYFWLLLAVVATCAPECALNALALRPDGAGVSTYIRELLRALPDHVDAELVAVVQTDAAYEVPAEVGRRVYPVAAGARRALAGLRSMGPADLVHGLDAALPMSSRVPTVASFHDLSVFDVPWAFTRRRAAGKRLQARHAIRCADAVIANSGFTAERISARFRREAVVVHLAPPSGCVPPDGTDVEGVRRRYRLPDRFVLHVGTVEPRKDVPCLVAACRRVPVPLVLAGAVGSTSLPQEGDVRALGFVPRSDLAALYGAATLVAYPSRYEGFGLPPLEAMACGAAVVATQVASLPEVLGDAAALVRPHDVDALAATLSEVLHDAERRAALQAAGLERARSFSWSRTAAETAAVYRSLGVSA